MIHLIIIAKFQIRVCEKGYLVSNIIPLLQNEYPTEIIILATSVLEYLSENLETHRKIVSKYESIKSYSLMTICDLLKRNKHFDITKYCLIIISNIASTNEYIDDILELGVLQFIIHDLLDNSDGYSQYYILRFIYILVKRESGKREKDKKEKNKRELDKEIKKRQERQERDQIHEIEEKEQRQEKDDIESHRISLTEDKSPIDNALDNLINCEKQYVEPLLRCMVSPIEKVMSTSIAVIRYIAVIINIFLLS